MKKRNQKRQDDQLEHKLLAQVLITDKLDTKISTSIHKPLLFLLDFAEDTVGEKLYNMKEDD